MTQITGPIESFDFDDRKGILKIGGHDREIWVQETYRPQFRDLKKDDMITVEISPGRYYDFLKAISLGDQRAQDFAEIVRNAPSQSIAEAFKHTQDKGLPPTSGRGRTCSARFMAKFRELVGKGLTVQQLVDELCLQEREIQQLKQALEVKEALETKAHTCAVPFDTDFDTIRPSHYVRLSRVSDPEKQLELAKKVAEQGLSVRQLEREIEGEATDPPAPSAIDWGETYTCPVCKRTFRADHRTEKDHRLVAVKVIKNLAELDTEGD